MIRKLHLIIMLSFVLLLSGSLLSGAVIGTSPGFFTVAGGGGPKTATNAIMFWDMETTNSSDPVLVDISTNASGTNDAYIHQGGSEEPTFTTYSGTPVMYFDGVDDEFYISITNRPDLLTFSNHDQITVSYSYNMTGYGTGEDQLQGPCIRNEASGSPKMFLFNYDWQYMGSPNDMHLFFIIWLNGTRYDGGHLSIDGTAATGVWHRVGLVYDSTNLYAFVDGQCRDTNGAASGTFDVDNTDMLFRPNGTMAGQAKPRQWEGYMRDVLIHTQAYSHAEMTNDYETYKFW